MGCHDDRNRARRPADESGYASLECEPEVEQAAEEQGPEHRPPEEGERDAQDVEGLEHRSEQNLGACARVQPCQVGQ